MRLHHVDECGLLLFAQLSSVARCAARAEGLDLRQKRRSRRQINLQSRARRSLVIYGPLDEIAERPAACSAPVVVVTVSAISAANVV